MTFKIQQVLRTKVPLKTESGDQVSPGTRVVVAKILEDGKARVRVADPNLPNLAGFRLVGSIGAFISTPILKKSGDVIEDFGFSLGTGF